MNRLRVQLVVAFTLVVLAAVGAISVLLIGTTNAQFRQYITHSGMQAAGSGMETLVSYYERQGDWKGVEVLLEQAVFVGGTTGFPDIMSRMGSSAGRLDVILADSNGRIAYDSAGETEGKKLRRSQISRAMPLTLTGDDTVIGYLLLALPSPPARLGQLEQAFLDRMQRILLASVLLAVVVALALGGLISRGLTAPLQRLAAAARAVAAGNLDHRVEVEGSHEMSEVATAFNDMTTALGESERQRQNMVADVAHELRTPLTVLQGNLRAILDGVYDLDRDEISRLYDETRLLGRLVDDLRELAQADAGQLRLNVRSTDLAQVVQSAVESLAPAADMQQVALHSLLPADLPRVQADPDRVAQILRNLVLNALRHTPAGGSVSVRAAPNAGAVEVAVEDSGEGIGPADLPHVFERFWRADRSRTRSGGTGLGLSVAQSLVTAMEGRIWAESALGQGSTFRFTLPAVS